MKIYISGPITNFKYSKEIFKGAEELLKMQGHEVLNPHEFIKPKGLAGIKWIDWAIWMRHDLQIILQEKPDLLVLLPGWVRSFGSKIEIMHSLNSGIKVGELRGDKVYLHHEIKKRRIEMVEKESEGK